ncbi:hypothetical protein QQF73_12945 [Marinobacter sp. M216]|uniref:DUF2059 domain-containing protein n=1 Tax=Marinobacter albus TaxID=3030833 RepID=A0ABT7HDW3_9GAMM|nr:MULTISPECIES: hypothetical protein [unclassified Marinobacter]MBW7471963.1 hypothetical protein [Marinobacter sp. F4218]MDK9558533.1 hypothetical protein [Marinobacter sp. M216]
MIQPYPDHQNPLAHLLTPLLIAVLALASLPAQARDLTEQTIRSFVDTMKAAESLEPEFEALADEMATDQESEMPDFAHIFSDTLSSMEGQPAYGRLEDIAQDHGFSDLEEWGATGDRIYRAWMAIELERQNPEARQEMASALAEIENSPHLTEAQKAQMRAMMENAMRAMESAKDAPQEDVEAVRPHLDILRSFSQPE